MNEDIFGEYDLVTRNGKMPGQAEYALEAELLERWLTDWLPRKAEAACLDLGCGAGPLLYLLNQKGIRRPVGVDLCDRDLAHAKEFVTADLVRKDILSFLRASPEGAFDCVFAMNVLEHMEPGELMAVTRECRRILKADGVLIGMVPNAVSPFGGMTRYWDLTHQTAFTPTSLKHLATLAGFRRVAFRECGPRVHGLRSMARVCLWRTIRQALRFYLLVESASTKGDIYTSDMLFRMEL